MQQKWASRTTLLFLLAGVVFLYLETFILPYIPIYAGDNGPVFMLDALRMRDGQVMYRDFFELTLPGMPMLYGCLFKAFGVRAWIPAALLVLGGAGILLISILISKSVMSGPSAVLPGLAFLTFCFANSLDATHHLFSVLAVLGATAVIIRRRSPWRLAWAGVLCGLAALFTQSRGVMALVALGLFCWWESRSKKLGGRWLVKSGLCLTVPFLLVVLPVVAYFAWKAGPAHFLFCTVIFLRRYWSSFSRDNLGVYMVDTPEFTSWVELPAWGIWLFIHALVPLVFLWFFVRYGRQGDAQAPDPWDRLMLLNAVGLSSFLAIASAPSWARLCTAALPALILFIWFVNSSGRFCRFIRGLLWVVVLAAAVVEAAMRQTDWRGYLSTPVGRVAFVDRQRYEKYGWLADRTRARDFFLEAEDADMYFLLGLRNPGEVPFLTPSDFTRPEQVQDLIKSLDKHKVRFVLWGVSLDFPDPRHPAGDHLGPLRAYLRDHYRVVKAFDDGAEMWERE
jgi:hypothetical protein